MLIARLDVTEFPAVSETVIPGAYWPVLVGVPERTPPAESVIPAEAVSRPEATGQCACPAGCRQRETAGASVVLRSLIAERKRESGDL